MGVKPDDQFTDLSDVDLKIIDLLRVDGRMTTRDLAKSVGVSEVTARRRLKRLQDDGVFKVIAVVSPGRLNTNVHVMVKLKVDVKRVEEVAKAISELPEVRFLSITTGAYDVHFTAFLSNTSELMSFVADKVARIDGVAEVETVVSLKVVKSAYNWLPIGEQNQFRT